MLKDKLRIQAMHQELQQLKESIEMQEQEYLQIRKNALSLTDAHYEIKKNIHNWLAHYKSCLGNAV